MKKILMLLISLAVMLSVGCVSREHTVTLYVDGEIFGEPLSITRGEFLEEPEPPEREGYIFKLWSTDENGENVFDFEEPIARNLNLHAQWERQVFDLTFELNDGTNRAHGETQTVYFGDTAREPEPPSREGYNFVTWTLDPAGNEPFDFTQALTYGIRLYAQWDWLGPLGGRLNGRWAGETQELSLYGDISRAAGPFQTVTPSWSFDGARFTSVFYLRDVSGRNVDSVLSLGGSIEWLGSDHPLPRGSGGTHFNQGARATVSGTFSITGDRIELVYPNGDIEVLSFAHTANTIDIGRQRFTRQ